MIGALIMTLLTYLAMSPQTLARLRLANSQLPYRAREFVGYTVACLLLVVGFFLAGVPITSESEPTAVTIIITATPLPVTPTSEESLDDEEDLDSLLQFPDETPTLSISSEDSGSFGSSVGISTQTPEAETELATLEATNTENEEEETEEVEGSALPSNTPEPQATETAVLPPTLTATSAPTLTPTPTLEPTQTPVPPLGETAVIQTGGNTLWVRQTPGGRTLTLLNDGATVVLSDAVANWEGEVWQEIRTLDGTLGWIQLEFIQ